MALTNVRLTTRRSPGKFERWFWGGLAVLGALASAASFLLCKYLYPHIFDYPPTIVANCDIAFVAGIAGSAIGLHRFGAFGDSRWGGWISNVQLLGVVFMVYALMSTIESFVWLINPFVFNLVWRGLQFSEFSMIVAGVWIINKGGWFGWRKFIPLLFAIALTCLYELPRSIGKLVGYGIFTSFVAVTLFMLGCAIIMSKTENKPAG